MYRHRCFVLVLCLFPVSTLAAENWPQWRGPTLDGRSAESNLPVAWSAEENVAWKLEMPARSAATPIVWGDRIFLNVSFDPAKDDSLAFWCVDRDTGKVLWKRPLGGGNVLRRKQHMSTPSPVADGEHVWVMTGTGILKAFTLEGEEVWGRDIQADYGTFGLNWGYASSPLLFEDALYVEVLHGMKTDEPSYLLRIDKKTGETVWRVSRPTEALRESPDAYTTPALLRRGGRTDPERLATGTYSASPVLADGKIYATSETGVTSVVKAGPKFEVLAENDRGSYTLSSPAISDGQIFVRTEDYLYAIGTRRR